MMTSTHALLALTIAMPSTAGVTCDIAGTSTTPGDEVRARHACETARARFAQLFGHPVPRVRIVLWQSNGYRAGLDDRNHAVVFWPNSASIAVPDDSAAAEKHLNEQWQNILPHEIAHVLLAARFFAEQAAGDGSEYGTPLPDWLDEGVAIWAESLGNRRTRLDDARALPERRRDLRAILGDSHPATGNSDILAIRDGAPPPDDEALWAFYPQSIAVLDFVYDAGGSDATRELVERLLSDPECDPVSGLPGLPADFSDVVAAWDRWIDRTRTQAAGDG
ncbi:MAG: hypothetical protein ACRELD_14600 [Longimicrobiales bacterium]